MMTPAITGDSRPVAVAQPPLCRLCLTLETGLQTYPSETHRGFAQRSHGMPPAWQPLATQTQLLAAAATRSICQHCPATAPVAAAAAAALGWIVGVPAPALVPVWAVVSAGAGVAKAVVMPVAVAWTAAGAWSLLLALR